MIQFATILISIQKQCFPSNELNINYYAILYDTTCPVIPPPTPTLPPTPPPTPPPAQGVECCYYFSHPEEQEISLCERKANYPCPV